MTKLTWKKIGVAAAALSVGAFGLVLSLPSDAAISIPPPPPCQTQAAMTHIISQWGGPATLVATPGSLTAKLGVPFATTDGRQAQEVTITSLATKGDVQGVGFVDIQLDTTRDPGTGSIVSNKAGQQFPATQRMTAFITANINGREFRSMNRITLISTNVTSTPPSAGTAFNLANQVKFEEAERPGTVAMVMEPGQAAVIERH